MLTASRDQTDFLDWLGIGEDALQEQISFESQLREEGVSYVYGAGVLAGKFARVLSEATGQPPCLVVGEEFLGTSHTANSDFQVMGVNEFFSRATPGTRILCGILNKDFQFSDHISSFSQHGIDLLHSHSIRAFTPVIEDHAVWNTEYTLANAPRFLDLAHRLQDDRSLEVLKGHLAFRLVGDWKQILVRDGSPYLLPFRAEAANRQWELVDGGAYDGDTLRQVLARRDRLWKRISCIEPDPENFAKLERSAIALSRGNHAPDIQVMAAALAPVAGRVLLYAEGNQSSRVLPASQTPGDFERSKVVVDSVQLSSFLKGRLSDCRLLVKLDVEGAEVGVVREATSAGVLSNMEWAVSAYHRESDLLDVAETLVCMGGSPSLSLRLYGPDGTDLVLFAALD